MNQELTYLKRHEPRVELPQAAWTNTKILSGGNVFTVDAIVNHRNNRYAFVNSAVDDFFRAMYSPSVMILEDVVSNGKKMPFQFFKSEEKYTRKLIIMSWGAKFCMAEGQLSHQQFELYHLDPRGNSNPWCKEMQKLGNFIVWNFYFEQLRILPSPALNLFESHWSIQSVVGAPYPSVFRLNEKICLRFPCKWENMFENLFP